LISDPTTDEKRFFRTLDGAARIAGCVVNMRERA